DAAVTRTAKRYGFIGHFLRGVFEPLFSVRRMRMKKVMLSQQILSIIIAVRSPHNCVDMVANGRLTRPGHGLVIELYENHRALDPVVENPAWLSTPNPGKPCAVQIPVDL